MGNTNDSGCKNKGGQCGCVKWCAEKVGVRVRDSSERSETMVEDDREFEHQIGYSKRSDGHLHPDPNSGVVGYPNLKVVLRFDSMVKEKSPTVDMTGYSEIIIGEGDDEITISVTSGQVILRTKLNCRLVLFPMSNYSMRIEARKL